MSKMLGISDFGLKRQLPKKHIQNLNYHSLGPIEDQGCGYDCGGNRCWSILVPHNVITGTG